MNEGWYRDEYLILYSEEQIATVSEQYSIPEFLPGFEVVGLRGWDDFIVRDARGRTFCVPTVPLESRHLSAFPIPEASATLRRDPRLDGKIKWYVKPIAFGGDANTEQNVIWVTHEQHVQLVRWWNDQFRSLKK